jgi:hypothetical protein
MPRPSDNHHKICSYAGRTDLMNADSCPIASATWEAYR